MRVRTSWRARVAADRGLPKVVPIPARMQRRFGYGTIVVPAPREVEELIRKVPRGKLTTAHEIARALAVKHGATIGCAVTSGIFAWMVANAAHEDERAGRRRVTPYWRVVKAGGVLNPKYPGGIPELQRRLVAEGHVVLRRRGQHVVQEHEGKLAPLVLSA